jgi:hypothetical protein
MTKRFYKILPAVILIISLFSTVYAQTVAKRGTTAANFLEIAVGAPAMGMGGAFVSVANDASSLYWNVAGIANAVKYEALITHTDWIAETKFDYAGLILPLGEFGTLGFSFTSLSMDDMKVTTVEKPEGTGEFFSAGDIAVGISYARNLTDRFSIGFTAKYVQQSIWHMSASAIAIDAGTLFRTDLFGGMVIGASMSNFGTPMKLEGRDARYYIRVDDTKEGSNDQIPVNIELDSWELPLTFQIGVSTYAVNTEDYKLRVAVDALHPNNDFESVNAGGEFTFMDFIALRGGYQNLFLQDSEGGLSLGIGLNSKMLFSEAYVNFDYAYRDFGRLKNVHYFSVGVKF